MIHAEHRKLLRLRDDEGLPDELMCTIQRELDVRLKANELPR
ncbi:MAG: hypothetical protein U0990_03930 [Candidatus Nanopelagicales bacterium]|nr:hypothetical protein [Candidatus Nanopelagicales bacterium]MDZ4249222.1 hypothetical protein [Candidatus Nanopelagicales bacterium]